MKMEFASKSSGFRPKISDADPQKGTLDALASMKEDPIHAAPEVLVCREAVIVGNAVVRITVSRAARKTAVQRASMSRVVCRVVRGMGWSKEVASWERDGAVISSWIVYVGSFESWEGMMCSGISSRFCPRYV